MTTGFGGPMFDPVETDDVRSIHGKAGGHYNIYSTKGPAAALRMLRNVFPLAEANEMNFVLFSTSGVHGTYSTIEGIRNGEHLECLGDTDGDGNCALPTCFRCHPENAPESFEWGLVTFLLVQPRLVTLTYGEVPVSDETIPFLKKLRASSWKVVPTIGAPGSE